MSNYYTDRYNNFLQEADNIYSYLSGNYMNEYDGRMLDCGPFENTIGGMKIVEIQGYRKMENNQVTFDSIKSSMLHILESYHYNQCAIGYFIVSNGDAIKLCLASEINQCNGYDIALKGAIPDLKLKNAVISLKEFKTATSYGGVVTGAYNIEQNVIDTIIREIQDTNALVGLIAKPIKKNNSEQYKLAITELLDYSSSFENVSNTFGISSRMSVKRNFPQNENLKNYLTLQKERLDKDNSGLWEMCIWFGSGDYERANALGKTLIGTLSAYGEKGIERGHCFFTQENPFHSGSLALASAEYGYISEEVPHSLRKSALTSYVTSNELAGLLQLPQNSYRGINVYETNVTANSIHAFSTTVPSVGNDSFSIGNEYETGIPYKIKLNSLVGHMLVTGATGSGKTNTVMNVLTSVHNNGISFCIIEPAKRDYWHMISRIDNLKVFSPGDDALPLLLNPLAPEDGIIIGNHIDDLMYAFSGAFDMEEPTRLSIEGLLKYTYEKAGWGLDEMAYTQQKKYPTLKDMLANLDEYSRLMIKSGEEVRKNIEGSLLRRIESMTTGTMGRITSCEKSLLGRELCSGAVLVELDILSIDHKSFVASLLLIKMSQYLRQLDPSQVLKNVILLEEAHNVFCEVSQGTKESSKDVASKYFANLLSEIREYGTGIIIADQGASQINSNAISNTKIKIMHAASNEADVNKVAFAFRLSDFQKRLLPELKTGEAVVAILGVKEVCRIKVGAVENQLINYACLFCPHRALCVLHEIQDRIDSDTRCELVIAKIYNNRFDSDMIKNISNSYFKSLGLREELFLCALGYLLTKSQSNVGEIENRRIIYRYLH